VVNVLLWRENIRRSLLLKKERGNQIVELFEEAGSV
jgi:hypothetical protein